MSDKVTIKLVFRKACRISRQSIYCWWKTGTVLFSDIGRTVVKFRETRFPQRVMRESIKIVLSCVVVLWNEQLKPSNVVTEVFDGTTWSTLEPYPYWVAINSYGVVSLPDQVVLFGGRISVGNFGSDIIASFKSGNHGHWTSKLDDLTGQSTL